MKSIYRFISSILLCQLAGIIGSIFTLSSVNSWYFDLNKPLLNPPGWVFGPVWITLYFLMGISLFLIWNNENNSSFKKNALILFLIHLIFNASWSIVFFGLHQILLSVIVIIILWLLIFLIIIHFAKISRTASLLLFPYLIWVSFAIYLNVSIYLINK